MIAHTLYLFFMKKNVRYLLLFGFILSQFALHAQDYYPCGCLLPEKFMPATTHYYALPIYRQPSSTSEQVAEIHFGNEKVILTGEPVEGEKQQKMIAVSMEDGTTGWTNYHALIPCGKGGVIQSQTRAFKESNSSTPSNVQFQAGEPVITTEVQGNRVFTYSKDKKRQGWVAQNEILTGEEEINAAIALSKALTITTYEKRLQNIEALIQQLHPELQMFAIAHEIYNKEKAQKNTSMPAALTVVETEERSIAVAPKQPKKSASPSVIIEKPLKKKTQATQESPAVSVETREIPVNVKFADNQTLHAGTEKKAIGRNWEYVETWEYRTKGSATQSKFWVCYHPYLPKGARVLVEIPDGVGVVEMEVIGTSTDSEWLEFPKEVTDALFQKSNGTTRIRYYTKR